MVGAQKDIVQRDSTLNTTDYRNKKMHLRTPKGQNSCFEFAEKLNFLYLSCPSLPFFMRQISSARFFQFCDLAPLYYFLAISSLFFSISLSRHSFFIYFNLLGTTLFRLIQSPSFPSFFFYLFREPPGRVEMHALAHIFFSTLPCSASCR